MPTPSSDASTMPAEASTGPSVDSSDTLRFRAPTLESAITLAETSLGARVRVVAANRIRRGGIGGFFASDLGVEVTVALDDETMEQALERLVADGTAGDVPFGLLDAQSAGSSSAATPTTPMPAIWGMQTARDLPTAPPSSDEPRIGGRFDRRDDDLPAVNPVLAEVLAALLSEAADQQQQAPEEAPLPPQRHVLQSPVTPTPSVRTPTPTPIVAPTPVVQTPVLIVAPTAVDQQPRPVYDRPPTMVRVDEIIAELSAITAEPVFGHDRGRGRIARPTPTVAATAQVDAANVSDAARSMSAPGPNVIPTLPPRASEVARRASAASAAHHARTLAAPARLAAGATAATAPDAGVTDDQSASERLAESVSSVINGADDGNDSFVVTAIQRTAPDGAVHARVEIEAGADESLSEERDREHGRGITSPRHGGSSNAPSRRQVELAVAATDQLIESLTRDQAVKRLSVRVVLRTADRREVEAEAEWESS